MPDCRWIVVSRCLVRRLSDLDSRRETAPLASSLVQAALLATIWNIVLAAVFGVAALGCSAGKGLVEESARTGKPQPEPHG